MSFGIIILIRILFVVCMVFIIGYVFGPFAKKPALVVITKVAAILAVVLFVAMNGLLIRGASGGWHCGPHHGEHDGRHPRQEQLSE